MMFSTINVIKPRKLLRSIPWLLMSHFLGFGPTLNAIIDISSVFFTEVPLYPDLTQHKIIISEICFMNAVSEKTQNCMFEKVSPQHFSLI